MTPFTQTQSTLARMRGGDRDAVESLVAELTPAIYAHALRFFGAERAAEEITEQVWASLTPSLLDIESAPELASALFAATRDACLEAVRGGRLRPIVVDPFEAIAAPSDICDVGAVSAAVERAIRRLAPEDRDALSAVTLFGLTYEQASPLLGVPSATVRSRAFRARRSLALTLGDTPGGC